MYASICKGFFCTRTIVVSNKPQGLAAEMMMKSAPRLVVASLLIFFIFLHEVNGGWDGGLHSYIITAPSFVAA